MILFSILNFVCSTYQNPSDKLFEHHDSYDNSDEEEVNLFTDIKSKINRERLRIDQLGRVRITTCRLAS